MEEEKTLIRGGGLTGGAEKISRILRSTTIFSIYLIAFLAPLFYLPLTPDPLFGKQLLVMLLVSVALMAWLIRILIVKEITYQYGVVTLALGVLFAALFFASIFSLSPAKSLFGPDLSGETFASMAAFIVIAFLVASEFSRKEVGRMAATLLASGTLLALMTILRAAALISLPEILQINSIGSLNNAAVMLIAFFLFGLGFVVFGPVESRIAKILSRLLVVSAPVALLLIDFEIGWIGLAAFAALAAAFYSSRSLTKDGGARLSSAGPSVIFIVILGLAISLSMFTLPLEKVLPNLQKEISVTPSVQATLLIGKEILKTRPVLGSGPGTFVFDYNRFRSPVVNQTIFWNLKFTSGFSFLSTAIATLGTLGFLALLTFIFALLYTLGRVAMRMETIGPLEFGMMSIAAAGMIFWLIYPALFVMNLLLFLAIGAFLALSPPGAQTESFLTRQERRMVAVKNLISAFVVSLLVLAAVILTLLGAFYFVKKYAAEIYFGNGNFEFVQNGNADTALARYASALALDPANDRYLVNQSQVYLAEAQKALARIIAGDSAASAVFQPNLNAALESGRLAAAAEPNEPGNWLNLGQVYETAIPFVDGADRFAVASYQEAAKYDPLNPIPFTLLGRTYLGLVDLIDIRARQDTALAANAPELKKTVLENAKQNLEKAVELKSDYAAAQFLLAQAFTREGNIDEALRRGMQAAIGAPNDVGVAFFLGFLFYQKGDLANAEQQFSRAIAINPNYSNAMYFLGLIYDKTQRPVEALKQFRRIFELNPDNEEVRKIIVNLEAGRPALSAITPPPEKRKEPPIQETRAQQQKTQTKTGR
ncbi:MAG: tetratricopeptide repeat protein [Candidatus Sungiibacteriota bacterium]